jgi:hypothetical protein
VLFAIFWATLGGGGVALALSEQGTLGSVRLLSETERTFALFYGIAAILIGLLVLATAARPRYRAMASADRPRRRLGRPVRLSFGVVSGVAGGMALAASELSFEPVLMAGGLTGGGVVSLVVSFWSLLTSKRGKEAEGANAPAWGPIALEPERVARQLREDGWFVVEAMHLDLTYADYVAVGPAGVFAIQTFWTDSAEDGSGVRARARIAARKLSEALHRHEVTVEVVPVVLVCGPLPDDVTEAVAVVDDVAVLVARRAEQWRAELRQANALGAEVFEAVRGVLVAAAPADLART